MTAPRLEIDLGKIHHNAYTLVGQLALRGVSVTGVTKACLGSPEIARMMLRAGVKGLGDSRIENIEAMRRAGIGAPMTLIRSPMPSQVDRVVAAANVSLNTELDVVALLAAAARKAGTTHGIVLMVELGDLREGIMPGDLESIVREVLCFPNIALMGIGTNLACRSGVLPDARNMRELSVLADSIEAAVGVPLDIVSGGNSANLPWALNGANTGRINDLRLGEAILLGCEPYHHRPIEGLFTDAFTLIGEVIESKIKPAQPWGKIESSTLRKQPQIGDRAFVTQSILALGDQDTDISGLTAPPGSTILGATSDHSVIHSGCRDTAVGTEIGFQPSYKALVRAMTSPFVAKVMKERTKKAAPIKISHIEPPGGYPTPAIPQPSPAIEQTHKQIPGIGQMPGIGH